MLNKIYDKIRMYIKQNWKFFTVLIVLLLLCSIELPYYIDAPGGLLDVSTRVSIDTKKEVDGSFNLAYVSEYRATIPTLIYAFLSKDADIISKQEVLNNEGVEIIDYRNHLLLDEANQNAIMVAFDRANQYYEVTNRRLNVVYIDESANTDLEIKDQIIKINGISVESKNHLYELIKDINTKMEFEVINDGVLYNRYAYKTNISGNDVIGIILCEDKEIDTNIDIEFKFKSSESGPSGGAMMALSIYNYLTDLDLTKGMKIVGTGTIDEEGNVGSIGGVNYKIKAAVKEKADIFFVPVDNYEEALNTLNENNLNIKLVKISTIDEAVTYLKEL